MNIIEYAVARKLAGGSGGSGGGAVPAKDVNFRDYDGAILHSYTAEEALALTALPELPTQPGLICQEWNWSFEDMQSYVAEYGVCEIGATYITDDGKTRLYITISAEGRMGMTLRFSQTVAQGVIIDWGDDSIEQTADGVGYVEVNHTYNEVGDYVITLDVIDGNLSLSKSGAGNIVSNTVNYKLCGGRVRKVEIGANVTDIGNNAFCYFVELTTITIPNNITTIDYNAFYNCHSLLCVIFPNGLTSIGNYCFWFCSSLARVVFSRSVSSIGNTAFSECRSLNTVRLPDNLTYVNLNMFQSCYGLNDITLPNSLTMLSAGCFDSCYGLTRVTIPNGVTSIGARAFRSCSIEGITIPNNVTSIQDETFRYCYSLTNVTFPNSLTKIGSSVFSSCTSAKVYDFTALTAVPTLTSTSFYEIPSDCEIRVPAALAEEWKAATNWSTYAANIVGV